MRIAPLGAVRSRPFALLTPAPGLRGLEVDTLESRRTYRDSRDIANALSRLSKHVVYTPGKLRPFLNVSDPTEWEMTTWRGRPVSLTHTATGVTIYSLRGSLDEAEDRFASLVEVIQWLGGYGVTPGTISSMAWSLFRSSLPEPVTVSFDAQVSDLAFYGGRQEISKPGSFFGMAAWDIKSAYPFAMASEPLALSLREVSKSSTMTEEPGLAAAIVTVPFHLPYGPLPLRVAPHAISFPRGTIKGVWPWRELKAAASLGCRVEVIKAWAPRRTFDLFGPWWRIARTGRDLPGAAATLAKMITNSTWGQFAMKGEERVVLHFTGLGDHDYVEDVVPARRMPHVYTKHVAAEIASRVRVKTLLEGIYATNDTIAHIDTDGIIIRESALPPDNVGDDFGQWRIKEEMVEVEVRAPQVYRYRAPRDPRWRYVAAGMSIDGAKKEFERRIKEPTAISYLGDPDMVVPSGVNIDHTHYLIEKGARL